MPAAALMGGSLIPIPSGPSHSPRSGAIFQQRGLRSGMLSHARRLSRSSRRAHHAATRRRVEPVECVSAPQGLGRGNLRMLTAKKFFLSMWNESNIGILEEIASPEVIHSDKVWCEYDLAGIKRVKKLYHSFMAGYPDCHYDIISIGIGEVLAASEEDNGNQCVLVHWNFRGTNLGELWDAPATGRHTQYSGMHVLKFDAEDRISHIETYRQPSEDERRQMAFCWSEDGY